MLKRAGRIRGRRRGMILMVVLALLTLFAIVGITFVFVANSQEMAARIAREGETQFTPQVDPEAAFAYFLGQMLYDTRDEYSGLRGHSLGRNLYGLHDVNNALNDKPYSGVGRLSFTNALGIDDLSALNYITFAGAARRNPEEVNGQYVPMAAVPYTYPDHNNFYLGQMDPATGEILLPSFHREYLFGRLDDPNNANWTNQQGKYLTLRPTRSHHPNFPMPVDRGGDVKNLDGAPGGCDSIWIDIGAPVMTAPDGRRYKMLVAPLILELDSRVNLNVLGNLMGLSGGNPQAFEHRSHQGWGPWEVNLAQVLNANATEWLNVFLGANAGGATANTGLARYRGRYDQDTARGVFPQTLQGNQIARAWAQVDFDAAETANKGVANRYLLPTPNQAASGLPYVGFPTFPTTCFSNGGAEMTSHAAIFNLLGKNNHLGGTAGINKNRLLAVQAMAKLLRVGGTGSDMMTSELLRMLPQNLVSGPGANARRNLVTLLSADLDWPGATPYNWDPNTSPLVLNEPANQPPTLAGQAAVPFPQLSQRNGTPNGSEFDAATWRSRLANLGRLDLKRKLPDYVNVQSGARQDAQALAARQELAREIFEVLRQATGGQDPATAFANRNGAAYKAVRHLAQLAVNMVDYLDPDDVMTIFNIPGTTEWVAGFELPRAVINEVYVQVDHDASALENFMASKRIKAGESVDINIWVELMNPIPKDTVSMPSPPNPANTVNPDCTAKFQAQANFNSQTNYRLLVVDARPYDAQAMMAQTASVGVLRQLDNTLGDPDFDNLPKKRVVQTLTKWGTAFSTLPREMPPSDNGFDDKSGGVGTMNRGFYVVGPTATTYEDDAKDNPGFTSTIEVPELKWKYPAADYEAARMAGFTPRPMLVLQRLANPALPPQPNANQPDYNPYVTVDFHECQEAEVMDGRRFDTVGDINPLPPAIDQRKSFGRNQPFAAELAQRRGQDSTTPTPNKPKQTFFRQNSVEANPTTLRTLFDKSQQDPNLRMPFDWLVHLDRIPRSAIELLDTSPYRPYDVLQFFWNNNMRQGHKAPWTDQTSRLHRFLEFVSRRSIDAGLAADNSNPQGWYGISWGNPRGRLPGILNLNMMMDQFDLANNPQNLTADPGNGASVIFRALCDPQGGNVFSQAQVDQMFRDLINQRTPLDTRDNKRRAGPTDQRLVRAGFTLNRPFWSLAVGNADNTGNTDPFTSGARGSESSIFRQVAPGATQPPLFDVPTGGLHPHQQKELLTKIFNNFTTRSNVFAVWLTVGFFRVEDESVTPPRLGAEIGKAENRQVRYRMFGIVDRSQMQLWPMKDPAYDPNATPAESPYTVRLQNVVTIPTNTDHVDVVLTGGGSNPLIDRRGQTITTMGHPYGGRNWTLQENAVLVLDPGIDIEETVIVRRNGSGQLYIRCTYPHAAGCPVIARGNPGPWLRYDPRKDTEVVPFFMLID